MARSTDASPMGFGTRRSLVVGLASTVVVVGAVSFAEALPVQSTTSSATVKMTTQQHYTASAVRDSFAAHQIVLQRLSQTKDGTVTFTDADPGARVDSFLISLFGPTATVHFGKAAADPSYEARLGNIDVTYFGKNGVFAGHVKAAVAELTG
jgi:hypothetical protein